MERLIANIFPQTLYLPPIKLGFIRGKIAFLSVPKYHTFPLIYFLIKQKTNNRTVRELKQTNKQTI